MKRYFYNYPVIGENNLKHNHTAYPLLIDIFGNHFHDVANLLKHGRQNKNSISDKERVYMVIFKYLKQKDKKILVHKQLSYDPRLTTSIMSYAQVGALQSRALGLNNKLC